MSMPRLKLRAACCLVCVGAALACGGKSAEQSVVAGGGGDFSGDGGVGGNNVGDGGNASGGDSPGGGTSSLGGTRATGGDGTGGSGDVATVATLGEPCGTPGDFACAETNSKLALICGGDGEWEVRETCAGDAVCDPNGGENLGTCRTPVADCALADAVFCDGSSQVVTCAEGGFETELVDECASGYACQEGACVLEDDPCPEDLTYSCSSDCEGNSSGCVGASVCSNRSWSGPLNEGPSTIRIPKEELCFECDRLALYLSLNTSTLPNMAARFTIGPGWGLIASDAEGSLDECGDPVSSCVVVPPTSSFNTRRDVLVVSISDAPVARNLTMEPVPPGTTCD